jgi:hypothetical protein
MVEHPAVNRNVVGSSPTRGAKESATELSSRSVNGEPREIHIAGFLRLGVLGQGFTSGDGLGEVGWRAPLSRWWWPRMARVGRGLSVSLIEGIADLTAAEQIGAIGTTVLTRHSPLRAPPASAQAGSRPPRDPAGNGDPCELIARCSCVCAIRRRESLTSKVEAGSKASSGGLSPDRSSCPH